MSPEDREEFLRRFPDVLHCVERFAQGEQRREYPLRRGIVLYWYSWWRCSSREDCTHLDASWWGKLFDMVGMYCDLSEMLVDEDQQTPLDEDSRLVKDGLLAAVREATSRGGDLEGLCQRGCEVEAHRLVHDLLLMVYDWEDNLKLQMFLWAVTDRRPNRNYVNVQKKLVWDQICVCFREHMGNPEEQ